MGAMTIQIIARFVRNGIVETTDLFIFKILVRGADAGIDNDSCHTGTRKRISVLIVQGRASQIVELVECPTWIGLRSRQGMDLRVLHHFEHAILLTNEVQSSFVLRFNGHPVLQVLVRLEHLDALDGGNVLLGTHEAAGGIALVKDVFLLVVFVTYFFEANQESCRGQARFHGETGKAKERKRGGGEFHPANVQVHENCETMMKLMQQLGRTGSLLKNITMLSNLPSGVTLGCET